MLLETITEFLYTWEVRLGVILSMLIQIILIFCGSRRKISEAILLKILVWCAYMSADVVAAFSLGLLAQNKEELCKMEPLQNHQLQWLWVPFLIVHLGGPDTITAYSLEDNKLWLRHLFNLVIQVGMALYAIIKSWNKHNPLRYFAIPIFISGAIKYCERIWALKSASLEQIYDRFSSKCSHDPKGTYFDKVYQYLSTLTYYFTNRLPSYGSSNLKNLAEVFLKKTPSEAFKLVEVEIGLVHDLLYTKALLIYSRWGICLRCVHLVSSIATMTIFAIIHKHNQAKWPYPLSDVLITYFLMIGAVVLEIYAVFLIVFSDWALIWLDGHRRLSALAEFAFQIVCTRNRALFGEKRWSRRMKQYNVFKSLDFDPRKKRRRFRDVSVFSLLPWETIDAFLGRGINSMKEVVFEGIKDRQTGSDVNEMKKLISEVIHDRVNNFSGEIGSSFTEFLHGNIDKTLQMKYNFKTLTSFGGLFIDRLFSWHIATTLCYLSDSKKGDDVSKVGSNCNANTSSYISNYLMYLARFREKMLPAGNYKPTLESLESYIHVFMEEKGRNSERLLEALESYIDLLMTEKGHNSERSLVKVRQEEVFPPVKRGDDHNVGYGIACGGFDHAILLQTSFETRIEKKWEMMAEFWVEMLLYVASHHRWEEHVQQLNRGGEFITHVAFLLAHASMVKPTPLPAFFTI